MAYVAVKGGERAIRNGAHRSLLGGNAAAIRLSPTSASIKSASNLAGRSTG